MLRKRHCKLNGKRGKKKREKIKKKEKGSNPTRKQKAKEEPVSTGPVGVPQFEFEFLARRRPAAGPEGPGQRGQRGAGGAACRRRSAPPEGARAPPLRGRRARSARPRAPRGLTRGTALARGMNARRDAREEGQGCLARMREAATAPLRRVRQCLRAAAHPLPVPASCLPAALWKRAFAAVSPCVCPRSFPAFPTPFLGLHGGP